MGILIHNLTKKTAVVLGVIGTVLFASPQARAQSREYELKAAFLLNFTQYVKWPANALPAGAPFTIGIVGGDPFAGGLDKAVQGETVAGRKIVVRHGGDMRGCQMVFVSRSGGGPGSVQGPGVLTVGESAGFARQGGVVEFYLKDNKVSFEVNSDAAEKGGLRLGSQLLRLSKASGN